MGQTTETMERKRIALSVSQKLDIIDYAEKNPTASQGDIARHFSVAQPTVSTIIRKKDSISALATKGSTNVKRNRQTNCSHLEKGLETFFDGCKSKALNSISYDLLASNGKSIAKELVRKGLAEEKDFPSTDSGWKSYIQRFLKKRSLQSKRQHGESADANTEAAAKFFDEVWPGLFESVAKDPSRVYNMDETGLFWRALPRRTFAKVDMNVKGSKVQKDRLTFAVTTCMDGTRLPLHGLHTAAMPRAVAAAHTTPAAVLGGRWTRNKKGWMTEVVFCEWLLSLNQQFQRKGKKIILLIDNCPAHKVEAISDRLDFVNVVFLPANTTSIIQPCDAGIINAFKSNYRRLMLRKVGELVEDPDIAKLDTSTLKKNINMLHCLQYAKAAWESTTESTIKNCWRKAGFSTDVQPLDDSAAEEEPALVADAAELAELAELDQTAPTCIQPSDDPIEIVAQIADELVEVDDDNEDEDDTDTPPPAQPSTLELFQAMDTLRHGLYAANANDRLLRHVADIETFLLNKKGSRAQQTTLTQFFTKQ